MQIILTPEQLAIVEKMAAEGSSAQAIGAALVERMGSVEGMVVATTSDAHRARGRRALAQLAASAGASSPSSATPPSSASAAPTRAPALAEQRSESAERLEIQMPRTRIKTLQQLIIACEVDTSLWEVEKFTCNKWEMGWVGSAGAEAHELFQVKAIFRAKRAEHNAHQALDQVISRMAAHSPQYPAIQRRGIQRGDGLLLELSMPDLHLGKLAWAAECGENYDLALAQQVYREAFAALVRDAQQRPIERVLLPVGNDLLNCDGLAGLTTAGTPQSNDGRYQKIFLATIDLLTWAIDHLLAIAPVEVISIPGNHDTLSAWAITEALRAWYRSTEDVVVDNSPTLRKYRTWGSCLLGFTHGDKERPDDLPLLMATEQPQLWSSTRWREWHLGHLHKSATKIKTTGDKYHGVRVRTLPSLCASDVWHTQMGYTGNIRSAEAYYWHQQRGLAGTSVYNVVANT